MKKHVLFIYTLQMSSKVNSLKCHYVFVCKYGMNDSSIIILLYFTSLFGQLFRFNMSVCTILMLIRLSHANIYIYSHTSKVWNVRVLIRSAQFHATLIPIVSILIRSFITMIWEIIDIFTRSYGTHTRVYSVYRTKNILAH